MFDIYLTLYFCYFTTGLFYIRSYRMYVDHTFPYKLVLSWPLLPIHLAYSDFKNKDRVIRIRDDEGRACRLLVTKDTKFNKA